MADYPTNGIDPFEGVDGFQSVNADPIASYRSEVAKEIAAFDATVERKVAARRTPSLTDESGIRSWVKLHLGNIWKRQRLPVS